MDRAVLPVIRNTLLEKLLVDFIIPGIVCFVTIIIKLTFGHCPV
jgi:hypothetical protein